MRNAFMDELINAARVRDDIVLIIGDLGYSVIEPFADEFPDRFFNAGIAEQNMMGMAAGMASEGMQVFTYSIGNFPTLRCAEQIRNDVDYHNLPVTNVVVGGGVTYGLLGYSHHAIQDYALMRSLPNMTIASPGDPLEVRACMEYILKNKKPYYLRMRKGGEKIVHSELPVDIESGIFLSQNEKQKDAVISTGGDLNKTIKWVDENTNGRVDIYSVPIWGAAYEKNIYRLIKRYKKVITYEDHLSSGGFGSWVNEICIKSNLDIEITNKSLSPKICGMVAKQETLHNISKLR